MREIKFRAWDKIKNKMVSHRMACANSSFTQSFAYSISSIELMQYTGLKDKNGVEIYEGDILKLPNQYRPSGISRFKQDQLLEVKFEDGYTYCHNIKYNEQAKYYYGVELHIIHKKCEVIGNIYENPELLEVK